MCACLNEPFKYCTDVDVKFAYMLISSCADPFLFFGHLVVSNIARIFETYNSTRTPHYIPYVVKNDDGNTEILDTVQNKFIYLIYVTEEKKIKQKSNI